MKKRLIGLGVLALVVVSSSGCALIPSSNYYWGRRIHNAFTQNTDSVQSAAGRMHTLKWVADQDARGFVDDLDYIFLVDRPSRLSRWHNR